MSNQIPDRQETRFLSYPEKNPILTRDLVQFLRNFSNALKSNQTGNPSMSIALSELSKALQPHSDRYLCDVLSEFKKSRDLESSEKTPILSRFADANLQSISLEDVESLLSSNELYKKDIVDLGHTRFGISKSKLERQSKANALESVRSALGNEKTLRIVGEEATRSGLRRST